MVSSKVYLSTTRPGPEKPTLLAKNFPKPRGELSARWNRYSQSSAVISLPLGWNLTPLRRRKV